jgi:adenylylsulfate kinase
MIIWLMGLPGSGKSTLALELEKSFKENNIKSFVLDGDVLRTGINSDLGFSVSDRFENVRRVAHIAKLMHQAGIVTIVASILPLEELRVAARGIINSNSYIEVYLKCPLDVCKERDPKGMYKKAISGEIKEFTGISAPFEEPVQPDIIIDTDTLSCGESSKMLLRLIAEKETNGHL